MEIETKVDLLTMLTFAELKSKIESKVDKLMQCCEYLSLRDVFEEICNSNNEKYNFFKDEILRALSKYDYYKHTWYLKPLKILRCKQCKKQFKTKSRGQWFCCDRCKNLYQEVNRLYGDYKL